MDALAFKKLDFQEFCAAAISVHQMEALEHWEQYARTAYEYFEKDGNRVIDVGELARVSRHSLPFPTIYDVYNGCVMSCFTLDECYKIYEFFACCRMLHLIFAWLIAKALISNSMVLV